jgi:hypothetical protein
MRCSLLLLLALFSGAPLRAAASPWPAGEGAGADLAGAEADLSGACWNPVSGTLWVVRQNRRAWELLPGPAPGEFAVLRTLVLPSGIGGDIEAVTQVDPSRPDELYTLAEDEGRLARVDLAGTPTVTGVWNLETPRNGNALPPETNGLGAEGLAFVPDAPLLAAGFRYPDGSPFGGSTRGMGGLVFVGHQIGGSLHVFDVNPEGSDDFLNLGSFATGASETAGLEFDRVAGVMYLWHNPLAGNSLEVSTLASDAQVGAIDRFALYDSGAPAGNLEGIAIASPAACGSPGSGLLPRTLFLTLDSASPQLQVFDGFPCDCPTQAPCLVPVVALSAHGAAALALLLVGVGSRSGRMAAPPRRTP